MIVCIESVIYADDVMLIASTQRMDYKDWYNSYANRSVKIELNLKQNQIEAIKFHIAKHADWKIANKIGALIEILWFRIQLGCFMRKDYSRLAITRPINRVGQSNPRPKTGIISNAKRLTYANHSITDIRRKNSV